MLSAEQGQLPCLNVVLYSVIDMSQSTSIDQHVTVAVIQRKFVRQVCDSSSIPGNRFIVLIVASEYSTKYVETFANTYTIV